MIWINISNSNELPVVTELELGRVVETVLMALVKTTDFIGFEVLANFGVGMVFVVCVDCCWLVDDAVQNLCAVTLLVISWVATELLPSTVW